MKRTHEDAFIQEFEDYIKKFKERINTETSNSNSNISTDRKAIKTRKQKWDRKQLYRYFKRQTDEIAQKKIRT